MFDISIFRNSHTDSHNFDDILHIYETDSKWSVSFKTLGEFNLAHQVNYRTFFLNIL